MLIFFGARSTTRRAIETGQNCPVCGKEKSFVVVPTQVYFHIFWIPIFPLYRKYTWICSHCGATKSSRELPVAREIRRQARIPLWTFFGLGAVAAFILSAIFIGGPMNRKATQSYMDAPQEGDIYEVKPDLDVFEYSAMKVVSHSADSVYFVHHEYYVDGLYKVDDMLEAHPNAWDKEVTAYSHDDLRRMLDKGEIQDVNRPAVE